MTPRARAVVFGCGAAGFAALLLWGMAGLPGFGRYPGPYGDVLQRVGVAQRHATDLVSAVNFDYRGFDTIGEEFILFAAAIGVLEILREIRGEVEGRPSDVAPDRELRPMSEAVRLLATLLAGPIVLVGIWILAHGHLTPGGGFQGGVILGTGPLMVYLGGEYLAITRADPLALNEVAEAVGAMGFVAVGIAGLVATGAFLTNVLPLGRPGNLDSSGTMPLISLSIGIEVAGAILLLAEQFLHEAIVVRGGPGAPR